jgi:hypothetical protein
MVRLILIDCHAWNGESVVGECNGLNDTRCWRKALDLPASTAKLKFLTQQSEVGPDT